MMEEGVIDISESKSVDDKSRNEHKRKLGRERWQRWDKKQKVTKQARKEEEEKAAKKEKKRVKNMNLYNRRYFSPTSKLMDQLSFYHVNHVLSALSALCVLFRVRSDVDINQRKSNAILIINDGLLFELYACLQKRIGNSRVVVAGFELFSNLLSCYPFQHTSLRCTRKPPCKLWYDLFFVVIKRRDSCLNMAVKALYISLSEVYHRSTNRDRAAEAMFTATLDEETIILALISAKVVDIGHALSIYGKVILYGSDVYREEACKVVCSVVVDQATVELSIMTDAVAILFQLLKNDENKMLLIGPVADGVKERIKPYAYYMQGKIRRSDDGDKRLLMHKTNVVTVYDLLSKNK